jgi:hypothetical protein
VDPRSAYNNRLSTGLETPQIFHATQVSRLESRTVNNNLDRSGFGPDPERRLGDMRQLAVLHMSSCLLELVQQKSEVDAGGDDGGLVGVGKGKLCVCRGDFLELKEHAKSVQE